jgi:L-lactate dehydrogenase complex protein LldF
VFLEVSHKVVLASFHHLNASFTLSAAATFVAKSTVKAADLEHRRKINFNIGRYNAAVPLGKQQFADLETARQQAKNIKWSAIEHLDQHLLAFEKNIEARGGKVLWAATVAEAQQHIIDICRRVNCTTLVKSKSMVTEEIHLNQFLSEQGIDSIETDLGEYIQQLDGEAPYHIVTPAMHKSKEDVARLFASKLGTEPNLTPEQLTQVARHKLRRKYLEAQVGVTGANFLVADTGSIAITENEGNGRLSCAFAPVHIAVVGIEKVIPKLADLQLLWPLLSTYGTGQSLTVYNSLLSGPRRQNEPDGPNEMYVILLDNGRTNLLADAKSREALFCIRCGSCLNACPIYKNIGGHSYDTTYSGPIGSVITPWLQGMHQYKHLSNASSLCGNCTAVCPVRINLHELLLHNRHQAVVQGESTLAERLAWKAWQLASLNRGIMNLANGKMKNFVVGKAFTAWQKHHSALQFAPQSFNQLWQQAKRGQ